MNRKAFTLLELLVVVLIIGILSAIALPQYKMAVGKTKLATLKDITKSLAGAAQRYSITNNTLEGATLQNIDIEVPSNTDCYIFQTVNEVRCCKNIVDNKICLYYDSNTTAPKLCLAMGLDKKEYSHRLCQKEIGKSNPTGCSNESGGYCTYYY